MTDIVFDKAENFLGKAVKIKVDRPLGSTHPKHQDIVYGVNYGFVPGTKSSDGEELDAYLLGVDVPVHEFDGLCIAFLRRDKDDDDKLIVVPDESRMYSETFIREAVAFQEKFFESKIFFMKK